MRWVSTGCQATHIVLTANTICCGYGPEFSHYSLKVKVKVEYHEEQASDTELVLHIKFF